MNQWPSTPREEMAATRLLLPFETLMMTLLKETFMPDHSGPRLTTIVLSIKDLQGGSVVWSVRGMIVQNLIPA